MRDGPWFWHAPSGRFRIKAEADAEDRAAREADDAAAAARRKAQDERLARLGEAAAAASRRRYNALRRTVEACNILLSRDEVAALTNPVSSAIFLAQGLPE